jgi:hypothetical protein
MKEECELAYLAGFFDGEGSISLCRQTKREGRVSKWPVLLVGIGQINPAPLRMFKGRWGGYMLHRKGQNGSRPYWTYQVSAVKAESCLRDLQPYLRFKVTEANAALSYREVVNSKGNQLRLTVEEIAQRTNAIDHFHTVRLEARTATYEEIS